MTELDFLDHLAEELSRPGAWTFSRAGMKSETKHLRHHKTQIRVTVAPPHSSVAKVFSPDGHPLTTLDSDSVLKLMYALDDRQRKDAEMAGENYLRKFMGFAVTPAQED